MPTLTHNYDVKWILDKTNPRFHDAMKQTLTTDLAERMGRELHGSPLTPAELKLKLDDPTSMESHLLFAHAVDIFIEESKRNMLLDQIRVPEILEESVKVQKIPPIEWESEEAIFILPDPKKLKEENKDLFEQLKREMQKLEELRENHRSTVKVVKNTEDEIIKEFRENLFKDSSYETSIVSSTSPLGNFIHNKLPEFFGKVREKFREVTENAPKALAMFRSSSGQDAPTAEAVRAHTDVQLKISFYGQMTEVAEGSAVLRPSDIRRMEREKNAQGQTRFDKIAEMSRDQRIVNADNNQREARASVIQQEKVVQDTAARLHQSNQATRVVNDQSWMADRNRRNVERNSKNLGKAVGKDKNDREAKKSFIVAIQEKANKLADSAKKSFMGFFRNLFSASNKKNDRRDANEEAERSSSKPSTLSRRS